MSIEAIKALTANPNFKKDYTPPEERFLARYRERKAALDVIFARIVGRMKKIDKLVRQLGAEVVAVRQDYEEVRLNISSNCNNRHDYHIMYVIKRVVQHLQVHGGNKTDQRLDKSLPIQSLEDYANALHLNTFQELDYEVERRNGSQ